MLVLASRWFPFVSLFGEAGTSCIHLTVSPTCSLPCVLLLLSDSRNVTDFSVCSTFYLLGWSGNFFFFLIYFNWRLITLQYCGGFCHTFTWISHGCTCVPHPDPPSHLPPHPIPQGHPSAPALSTLSHPSNLDWWFISHMIIYMFQCYSVKSSHPRLLPQSPKVCFYICVSFAVSHIGSSLLSF